MEENGKAERERKETEDPKAADPCFRRRVYLPGTIDGTITGRARYEGGQWIFSDAPLEKFPLFVKEERFCRRWNRTRAPPDGRNARDGKDLSGQNGTAVLYEDAGDGYGYETGEFWRDQTGMERAEQKVSCRPPEISDGKGYLLRLCEREDLKWKATERKRESRLLNNGWKFVRIAKRMDRLTGNSTDVGLPHRSNSAFYGNELCGIRVLPKRTAAFRRRSENGCFWSFTVCSMCRSLSESDAGRGGTEEEHPFVIDLTECAERVSMKCLSV
ncbi:MAG: hypothetical protein ACLU6W_09970 [Lachnospiraceae bacterium]